VVIENWQEPPPWTAEPRKEMTCVVPASHWFIPRSMLYAPGRCLQGKSAGARGELLRVALLKGFGFNMIICAEALAARAKRRVAWENMLTFERL
jgi:hypothetical protein